MISFFFPKVKPVIKRTRFASVIEIKKKNDKADLTLMDDELHHIFDQYKIRLQYRCRRVIY